MPRRTPDQGVKPFEYRTGVGNLPKLGGMFRSGDPAIIPPHKQHLAVNMRITPGGIVTRPGFATEADTGTAECIDGLTGPPGGGEEEPLVGLAIYDAGYQETVNGGGSWTDTTLGTIALIKEKDPTAVYNNIPIASPRYPDGTHDATGPFLFRGRIHEFVLVERATHPGDLLRWGLHEYVLPEKAGDTGSMKLLFYLDFIGGLPVTPGDAVQRTERNELDGRLIEALYFLVVDSLGGVHLMRWDGATLTEATDPQFVALNTYVKMYSLAGSRMLIVGVGNGFFFDGESWGPISALGGGTPDTLTQIGPESYAGTYFTITEDPY